MTFEPRRNVGSLLVLAVVVIAAFGSAPASATPGGADESFQQTGSNATATNNTTVRHENPAAVDREGNLSELEGWLSGRLSQTLIDCSEGLEVGQYDACNRTDDYPEFLDKYANVTRDSDSESNETDAFERTRENQSAYATNVRRFRTTVEEYREARRNGSTQKARRLARRAQRIARQINGTSGQLTRGYRTIANGTGQNLTAAIDATRSITRNVTSSAKALSVDQFENTTITAAATAERISFRDPLRVTGRITTANGTPLADRTVRLQAGDRTRRTTTNASGGYSFTYRPTLLSLDAERVTLRYLPTNLSVYRGNRTSLPVEVQQVQPTIEATGGPERVRFDELITVSGRVAVDNTSVPSIPLAVSIEGQTLTDAGSGSVRTSTDGRFGITAELPKDVETGRQTIQLSLSLKNRALGPANTSVPVTVEPTATTLSINASQTSVNRSALGGPTVRVDGRLTTDDGQPIRSQPVTISVNGTTTVTATTDRNGRYTANVTVPEQVFADRSGMISVSIGAVYPGSGTNLATARARTSIQLTLPAQSTTFLERLRGLLGTVPPIYRVLIGLGLLLVGGFGAYWYRRRFVADRSEDESGGQPAAGDDHDRTPTSGGQGSLLETAREQLSAGGPTGAVVAAYTAARTGLQRDFDLKSAYTHWEFLDACLHHDLDEHRARALQQLTELYEQAAFSQRSLSETMATRAVDDAETVADTDRPPATEESTPDSGTTE